MYRNDNILEQKRGKEREGLAKVLYSLFDLIVRLRKIREEPLAISCSISSSFIIIIV